MLLRGEYTKENWLLVSSEQLIAVRGLETLNVLNYPYMELYLFCSSTAGYPFFGNFLEFYSEIQVHVFEAVLDSIEHWRHKILFREFTMKDNPSG